MLQIFFFFSMLMGGLYFNNDIFSSLKYWLQYLGKVSIYQQQFGLYVDQILKIESYPWHTYGVWFRNVLFS